jgi:N-acetylglucosamine kinase-like BadF-type ATPase
VGDIKRGVAIGIDAGGTKTVGILVDSDGREIERAQAGGANTWDVGPEATRVALMTVLEPLLKGGNVRAVCLGSAGVDRESDKVAAEKGLRLLVPDSIAIDVRNDAAAALGLVGPKRPAMVVIASTGSIAYGEGADGSPIRVGGHGAIIGDAGSAAAFGLAAARHTANVFDGLEPRGALAELVIGQLKLKKASDVVLRIQHPDLDVPLVATLAPLVAQAGQRGDKAATSIIEAEGNALAATAKRVAYTIRQESALPALLVGTIFSEFPEIREKLKAGLKITGPVVVLESSECVLGAARIAVELAAFSEGRSTEKTGRQ